MEDTEVLPSVMDGHEYQAGHHAATLRRMLWREHLGLLPAQPLDADEDPNAQPPDVCPNNWHEGDEWDKLVADPLCDDVWNLWTQQATTNTEVFRHLFHADPDDNIRTFEDYQNFLPRNDMLVEPKAYPSSDVPPGCLSCPNAPSEHRSKERVLSGILRTRFYLAGEIVMYMLFRLIVIMLTILSL
jgi:hypothetical protein